MITRLATLTALALLVLLNPRPASAGCHFWSFADMNIDMDKDITGEPNGRPLVRFYLVCHESLVDHGQGRVLVLNFAHPGNLDDSDWGATPAWRATAAQATALSANGRVSAALDDGKSMSARPPPSPSARRPIAAAVRPLNATASSRGWLAA